MAYTFKHTGGTMQSVQPIKSGRGGFRVGAGRKPTGNHKTVPIRVDERLLNFIEWTRKNGVDDVILQTLEKLQQGDAPHDYNKPISTLLAETLNCKPKDGTVARWKDKAIEAIGISVEKRQELTTEQKRMVVDWVRDAKRTDF